eukprot:1499069-Amphidinium_carterae.1
MGGSQGQFLQENAHHWRSEQIRSILEANTNMQDDSTDASSRYMAQKGKYVKSARGCNLYPN